MFCPRCGAKQTEDVKFCKVCGANLYAVRQVVDSRESTEKFDWGKTWVAEMFLSGAEATRRKEMIDRLRGLTPEVKRINEIKAGVITSSVGVGTTLFLYVLMQGIILGGRVPDHVAEILARIWVAGLIPVFVGLALIINGVFVSKKLVEIAASQTGPDLLDENDNPRKLESPERAGFITPGYSVTEPTTKHLRGSGPRQ